MIEKQDREKMIEDQASDGPDAGGNRPYDYISLEEYKQAEEELKYITKYEDLNKHHIVVLRQQAKDMGLQKDVIDRLDRLGLIQCLFYHYENRDMWIAKARELEARLATERRSGYLAALSDARAAVLREQNYREYRQDQDGSGVGACKEIIGYLNVLGRAQLIKPGQTVCAHGNPEPMPEEFEKVFKENWKDILA